MTNQCYIDLVQTYLEDIKDIQRAVEKTWNNLIRDFKKTPKRFKNKHFLVTHMKFDSDRNFYFRFFNGILFYCF